jgi:hypothetical protein
MTMVCLIIYKIIETPLISLVLLVNYHLFGYNLRRRYLIKNGLTPAFHL